MIITLTDELDKQYKLAIKRLKRRNEKTLIAKTGYFLHSCYTNTFNSKGIGGIHYGYHSSELQSMLGQKTYLDVLAELEASGIISIDSTYSADGGKTKAYKIDTSYLDGNLISYHVPFFAPGTAARSENFIEATTLAILNDCTINADLSKAAILDHISNHDKCLKNVTRNYSNPYYNKIHVYSSKYASFKKLDKISHSTLVNKFVDPGYEIIKQGKDQVYLMPWNLYLHERKRKIKHYWTNSIDRFAGSDYFISRDSNGRLYSNIVNMPGPLLKYIEYNGHRFKELDLKSSQFTFLLYCFENPNADNELSKFIRDNYPDGTFRNHPGYVFFKSLIMKGHLYEEVQRWLGKPTRNDAKTVLFELLFSKVKKDDSQDMAVIRRIFGTVVQICEKFKQTHGYKALANELQRIEAKIMIDDVLNSLYEAGHPILSKHDSFLIPGNLMNLVKPLIVEKLDSYFGADNYILK